MSGDLISLRVLIVSAQEPERDLMRQGGALASVPADIVEAENAAKARALLSRGDVDIVLICGALAASEQGAIVKAAREAANPPLIVVLTSPSGPANAFADPAVAPDATIQKPVVVDEARRAFDGCIRARMPCRALVVDDSSTMRNIVKKILAASRFQLEIAEAGDGAGAVRKVREEGHDMVFLDYNMPGLDGFATLAELKRARPNVIVVIMTSTQDEAIAIRAREAGAAAFLKKPFFPADIDAVLYGYYGLTPIRRS